MKKYLLAAALVMASTYALADRVVSGTGQSSTSKADACSSAKNDAQSKYRSQGEEIDAFTKCECDQTSDSKWHCSVDAHVVKEK